VGFLRDVRGPGDALESPQRDQFFAASADTVRDLVRCWQDDGVAHAIHYTT
jgi:hypothetical protein